MRDLRRPFTRGNLDRAREIVASYTIVLEPCEGGGYVGHTRELPGVFGNGRTASLAATSTLAASVAAVATLLERKMDVPEPISAPASSRA